MKKIYLLLFLLCTITSFAQKVDFSLSAGTGKVYIYESADKSVDVNYSLPLSLMSELKFTPRQKNWGLKLRVQNIQSTITGVNWMTYKPLNGYINSLTTSLLLENDIVKKNFSYGFNFGLGVTKETIQRQQNNPDDKVSSSYASFNLGGHFSYSLSPDFDLQLLPTLLCQDPFKSMGVITGNRRANFAGEDLSALINIGIRYKLIR